MHALSKYTALVEDFTTNPNVVFQGQDNAVINLHVSKKISSITWNKTIKMANYNESKKLIQLKIRDNE